MSVISPQRPEAAPICISTSSDLPDLPAFDLARLEEAVRQANDRLATLRAQASSAVGKNARTASRRAVRQAEIVATRAEDVARREREGESVVPVIQRKPIVATVLRRDAAGKLEAVRITVREALVEVQQPGKEKRVRSISRANLLETMKRRGVDIRTWHLEAAKRYRDDWDFARYGLTAERIGSSVPGSRSFSEADFERNAADKRARRGEAAMWPDHRVVEWIVVHYRTMPEWCEANTETGHRAEEQGRFLAALDRLARSYGIEVGPREKLG